MTDAPPPSTEDWVEAGAGLLARAHAEPATAEPERSILNLAERPRHDDWSLRAALVRLAQPEPVRAGALLEVVRRTEGALQPLGRALERHTVAARPGLTPDALHHQGGSWELDDDGRRQPDNRLVDLARLAGDDEDRLDGLAAAYRRYLPLDPEEVEALPLVAVAVALDALAERLARWGADEAPADPPRDEVDRVCRDLSDRLDRLGVPRETRPEMERRPPGRGERQGPDRGGRRTLRD